MDDGFSAFAVFMAQDAPETAWDREQWQDAVNAAEMLRLGEKARALGLISSDGSPQKRRCMLLLLRGHELGIEPDILLGRSSRSRLSPLSKDCI